MSELALVEVELRGPVSVARLRGEVDMSNARMVERRLRALALDATGPLVVEVSAVDYLDSAWFGALHVLVTGLAREGRAVRLACARGAPVRRVLELSGIEHLLPLDEGVAEALAALEAR